jgi:hypothetical protein
MLAISAFGAAAKSRQTFVAAPPKDGNYVPWRDPKEASRYYAGETIAIAGVDFHYVFFTDALQEEMIFPDWKAKMKVFPDHIYLDHPGIAYPHRITGYLDGEFVMITWRALEHLKRFGNVGSERVLFLESSKEPNKAHP